MALTTQQIRKKKAAHLSRNQCLRELGRKVESLLREAEGTGCVEVRVVKLPKGVKVVGKGGTCAGPWAWWDAIKLRTKHPQPFKAIEEGQPIISLRIKPKRKARTTKQSK